MKTYCKTLYFRCILILRFWNVEISLHFNLAFSQCSVSIYQAFDGQTEFLQVFNFAILSYSWNSFDAREKYVFYSTLRLTAITTHIVRRTCVVCELSDGVQLTVRVHVYFVDLVHICGLQNTRWLVRMSAGPQITRGLPVTWPVALI